jgi:hypothetical protein
LLSLDNLFAAYILADFVDCPAFADAVFEEIHARRASAVTPYTAEQIHFVLTNALSDQPLRTLLLDQVGRLILKGKYQFDNKEDQDLLQPIMGDLMSGVVKVVNETQVPVMHFTNPPIQHYQKHVARHTPSSKGVSGTRQPIKSF